MPVTRAPLSDIRPKASYLGFAPQWIEDDPLEGFIVDTYKNDSVHGKRPESWSYGATTTRLPVMEIATPVQNTIANSLEIVVSRLIALVDRSDIEYDEEFLPVEASAITTALNLLYAVGFKLGSSFPVAWVASDGDGGLSLEWRCDSKKVVLFVSPQSTNKIRVLFKSKEERGVDKGSPDVLINRLTWLTKAEAIHA